MTRLLKCYGTCGEKYVKSDLELVGSRNHCNKCAEDKRLEDQSRTELYSLIKMYYRISFPTGQMLKQIKNFKEQNNYTTRGIILTLRYTFDIDRSFKPMTKFGISFVPFKYEAAKEFYENQQKRAESIMSATGDVITQERTVSKSVIEPEVEAREEIDMNDLI